MQPRLWATAPAPESCGRTTVVHLHNLGCTTRGCIPSWGISQAAELSNMAVGAPRRSLID